MGYHEDKAKQFKTHLKMDEETYRKNSRWSFGLYLKIESKDIVR